ncbi:MAG: rRNA pseudouridine synthase [Candidatus Cloacimonetes bacterium]|nr:rRNA pseudouridine synthase [Candidatus Cloacimonadota bacterium]
MRINKFLAQTGLGSRRSCEKLIIDGKIKINGRVVTDLAIDINPKKDKVFFNNKLLKFPSRKIYLILNKPEGYLVTSSDPFERKTVFDLLPNFPERIFPVGRLDKNSCGLLILTNDGDFANNITHPKRKIPKVYIVKAKGKITKNQINHLRNGILLEDGKTMPAKIFLKSYNKSMNISKLRITISEGKKRQLKRMIKSVGSEVVFLKRLQIGSIKLGKLPKAEWRFLKDNEIKMFKSEKSK